MKISARWLMDRLNQCLESEDIHAEVEHLMGSIVARQIALLTVAEKRQLLLKLQDED